LHFGGVDFFLSGEKTSSGALKSRQKVEDVEARKRARRLRKERRAR